MSPCQHSGTALRFTCDVNLGSNTNVESTTALKREAEQQFEFLEYVVQEEDYATGIALQKNLNIGVRDHVLFGKNEGGGQRFHQWVDTLLETPDEDLPKLFQRG